METVEVTVRTIAININQTYRPGMSAESLYDFTRGVWRLDSERASKAKYAFSVYDGEILEVYEIFRWSRAGSTEYITGREIEENEKKTRFEFVGKIANEDVRKTICRQNASRIALTESDSIL